MISRRPSTSVYITIILIGLFYILSLPGNHTEVQDSLHNIVTVGGGNPDYLLISNHLLDNALYYAFWKVMQAFGYSGNIELAMIILNLAASIAAVSVLALILVRLRLPLYLQILSLIAVATAYAFWLHAVECEIYNLPVPFLLLSLHRMLLIREKPAAWGHVIHLALYTIMAVLLHQQHALFALVVLAGLLVVLYPSRNEIKWKGILSRMSAYGLLSMVAVLLTYYIVVRYVFDISEFSEMMQWMRGQQAEDKWGYWSLLAPVKALIGFSRAFIGGHFVFALPGVASALQDMFLRDYLLEEEVFMVRNLSSVTGIVLVLLSLAFCGAVFFLLYKIFRGHALQTILRSREYAGDMRVALMFSAVYVFLYGIFNTWWEPQNSELWTSLIPFVIISIMLLSIPLAGRAGVQFSLGVIVGCMVLVNVFGSILPQQSEEDDYWFQFNRWLINNAGPGDLIVSGGGFISDGYLLLYSGADALGTWNQGASLEDKFGQLVTRTKPKRIFFSSTIAAPPQSLVRRFKIDSSIAREFFDKKRNRLHLVHSDSWQQVYIYSPPVEEE